ncbi:hypothetical protein NGUA10_04742 [Salmonella enterica]|nr:hypothetical protein NGUA10_04742 [Salmonella enterica]
MVAITTKIPKRASTEAKVLVIAPIKQVMLTLVPVFCKITNFILMSAMCFHEIDRILIHIGLDVLGRQAQLTLSHQIIEDRFTFQN